MVLADIFRSFTACVCFGGTFITLTTYGLDGIDTQYP